MTKLRTILFSSFFLASLSLAACGDDGGGDDGHNHEPDGGTNEPDAGEETPNMPALGSQIDRVGRPAISTALVQTFNGDSAAKDAAKDSYNAAAPAAWSGFRDDLASSLGILDGLDRDCGNQLLADDKNSDGTYAGLAGVLMDDQLYVNSGSGECGTYLGLEAEVTGVIGAGAGGCGGRTLTDDVIERSYSVLSGVGIAGVDDGITEDGDCTQSNETFPFVCAPQGD